MTTQIPNSMLVSPGGGLVQSGPLTASTTLSPNATAVQNAIAASAGGGAAVSVVAGLVIPLDTAGNGKVMASQALLLNSVFTFSGGVEGGNCNFALVADGSHVPDFSAFIPSGELVIANGYVYKSAAGSRNVYSALYSYGTVLLYGQSAGATVVVPGAATLAAGSSGQTTQALTITAPATGSAVTSYATFYKRAIDPSYTAGPTGASLSVSITGLVASTSYNYKTVASNTAGAGPDSNVITASTTSATPAPVFSAQSAPGGTNGTAYTYSFLASNTTSFAVFSGALPAGVGLNTATGVISGTPTVTATATFVISATGPGGTTNSTSQSVVIAGIAGALSVATTPYTALNVTTLGFLDWTQMADPASVPGNIYYHKSTVNLIGGFAGVNATFAGNGQTMPYSWTAGDSVYTHGGVTTQDSSIGFSATTTTAFSKYTMTFPAGTAVRKARMYFKTFRDAVSGTTGKTTLRATLSDSSAAQSATVITPTVDGLANWAYEWTFTAASAGQTLTVDIEIAANDKGQVLLDLATFGT